jgi:hypothetical protein
VGAGSVVRALLGGSTVNIGFDIGGYVHWTCFGVPILWSLRRRSEISRAKHRSAFAAGLSHPRRCVRRTFPNGPQDVIWIGIALQERSHSSDGIAKSS